MEHGIHSLALKQIPRGLPIEQYVVERIGDDFGHPHQTRLDVVEIEEMEGSEKQTADTDEQPSHADVIKISRQVRGWLNEVE